MSTAKVLMFEPSAVPDTWDAFITRIGGALSELERRGDAASWETARLIVAADAEAEAHPVACHLPIRQIRSKVNMDLRRYWAEQHLPPVRISFLSDARKIHEIWEELFVSKRISHASDMPYQHYRQMAVCSLPLDQKHAIREWAEGHKPTQAELRQEIRTRVDALKGIYRPDFDLKVSNHWVFQVEKRTDGFDGGVNYDLYANLIHFFSDTDDSILDPFAGGGILADTLTRYRHFREVTQAEHSGPRMALMSDIAPIRDDIRAADVREGLPWEDEAAALALLDPPYWHMSQDKYAGLGTTIEEWLTSLRQTVQQTARCLVPHGMVAIMTDDYVRKERHEPVGLYVLNLLLAEGWQPIATIYNFNRNFTAMSPLEMHRAKSARLPVNGVKIIQVARKPVGRNA